MGAPETQQFQPLQLTVALDEARQQALASANAVVADAEALVVDCAPMAEHANSVLRELKQKKARIEAMHEDIVGPIRLALANARKWFTPAIEASDKAEGIIKKKLSAFLASEQERVAAAERARREVERKAREEAEQQAAAARARAEEGARKARGEAAAAEMERQRQEAEARRAREAGDKRAAAEAERKAQAAAAEKARKEEEERQKIENAEREANRIQMEAAARSSATAAPIEAATTVKGYSMRKNWIAELADDHDAQQALEKVICAIAGVEKCTGRRDLLSLATLDMKAASKLAKAQEKNFSVPGLRARNAEIANSRG